MFLQNLNQLNRSTLMLAVASIIGSLGNKYVQLEMGNECNGFLCGNIGRKIVMFCIVFIATRNVIVSFLTVLVFTLFMKFYPKIFVEKEE